MGSESTSPQRRAGAYNNNFEGEEEGEDFSNSLSPAGALDWLSAAWAGLTGHETTTGKSVNRSATRDGKTGCVGSVSPISVPAGGTANFRMDLYSRLRQQVGQAPIRGYGPSWDAYWEDRMSFIGQGGGPALGVWKKCGPGRVDRSQGSDDVRFDLCVVRRCGPRA